MFCEKCGQPLIDGERFCGNCGAPVAAAQPQQTYAQPEQTYAQPQQDYAQYQQEYAQYQPDAAQYGFQQQPEKKPRKPVNKKRIAIIAGAIVGCIAIFFAIAFATGMFKSDKDQVREVTTGTVHKALDFYNTMVEEGVLEELGALSVQIEPGQALKMAASTQGIDLSWLNNVKIDTASSFDDGTISTDWRITVNGTEITTLNAVIDPVNGQILLGVDGLSNSIARYDFGMSGLGDMSSALSGEVLNSILSEIDVNEVFEILEDYIGVALDALDDVEKSSGTITAAGVEGKCDVYTINISMKTVMNMEKELIEELIDDSRIKDLLEKIYPLISSSMGSMATDFDTFYDQFVSQMEAGLKTFDQAYESASDETMMTIVEYIDGDDLVGVRATSGSSGDIFFGFADGGDKFGVEATIAGKTYVTGTGSKDGDSLTGDIKLVNDYTGETFLTIKLKDYDYKAGEGTIEIPVPTALVENSNLDAQTKSLLQSAALRIVIQDKSVSFDVVAAGVSAVKVTFGQTAQKPASLDSNKSVVEMSSWMQTLNLDTIAERLRAAGMPQNLLDKLTESFGAMSGSGTVPAEEPADYDDPFYGEDHIRLTVWAASAAVPVTKELCSEFIDQYPEKDISITVKAVEEGDATGLILNDPQAAADVFSFAVDQLPNLNNAGVLSPVSDYGYDIDVWLRDSSASVDAATIDGDLLAYPETGENGYYLIYDKRVVSDSDARTLEGVLAACRKAGKKFVMDTGNGFYACSFLFTGGLELDGINDDGGQELNYYDEEAVLDSLEAFNQLFAEYKDVFQSANVEKILNGMSVNPTTVAAGIDGSWNGANAKSLLGENYGAVKLPTIKIKGRDTQIVSMNGYKLIGVNSYTSYPEAAHLLAKFLTDEDAQLRRAEEIAWSPSNTTVASSDVIADNPATVACLEQAEYSVPQVSVAPTFWSPVGSLGNYICNNGKLTRAQIKAELEKAIANIKDE